MGVLPPAPPMAVFRYSVVHHRQYCGSGCILHAYPWTDELLVSHTLPLIGVDD